LGGSSTGPQNRCDQRIPDDQQLGIEGIQDRNRRGNREEPVNPVVLNITSKDVGLTQLATVWLNDEPVVTFQTHTKHEEFSIQIATELVAKALGSLITERLQANASDWVVTIRDHDWTNDW
jgi:predicted glycosyl hydrolase (DUF1957 family)